jgi:O-antigen ligase
MKMLSKPDPLFAGTSPLVDRARLAQFADALAVAVALSLPWSTSATSILIGLWLVALVPTLDFSMLRRELLAPAGGLPALLWCVAALGMLWADVSWSERIAGLGGYRKLLLLPLLLAQFRRSGQAEWVLLGFVASCAVLLAVSAGLAFIPGLTWRGNTHVGVPVKDYIVQSELFAVCAFGLFGLAAAKWRSHRRHALAFLLAAILFAANIVYVETARTTLVAMVVLLVLFGFFQFGWRGGLLTCACAALLACAVWASSPYLRERVSRTVQELQVSDTGNIINSVGLRLEYWRNSLAFIAQAPIVGHGTGAIPELFRRKATAQTDPQAITTNPHNQVLVVALELGLLGTTVLLAMWIAHLRLFSRGCGKQRVQDLAAGGGEAAGHTQRAAAMPAQTAPLPHQSLLTWFGLVIVVQNVVCSMFNSHLFDFSQGWLYVWGVGVLGGSMLHASTVAGRQALRSATA